MSAKSGITRDSVVVIGAGIGDLTATAVLTRQGMEVTVLEAHIYSGGSAGTFTHKGYRFDADATLAGGFPDAGPMALATVALGGILVAKDVLRETGIAAHGNSRFRRKIRKNRHPRPEYLRPSCPSSFIDQPAKLPGGVSVIRGRR